VESVPVRLIHGESVALTPVGLVPLRCLTQLPKHSHILPPDPVTNMMEVFVNNEKLLEIPPCKGFHVGVFPADYDGWLAYTEWNYSSSIDTFLGDFSVPDEPATAPQELYVFTGLQNVNWIPKIDPIPKVFDIIQPVLQYPGDNGSYWSVRSWYVTVSHGVQVSEEVPLNVGDVVFGNMTRTGSSSYYIGSTSQQTGQSTSITADHAALASQPFAYTTIECYGCSGCSTEPVQPISFTKMSLTSQGNPITPSWSAFQSPHPICNTTAHITNGEVVTYTFGTH